MSILCTLRGHAVPRLKPIWNDGHFFSACPRCGRDIVRSGMGRRWTDVPRGYRVAWRERTEHDINWDAWPTRDHA